MSPGANFLELVLSNFYSTPKFLFNFPVRNLEKSKIYSYKIGSRTTARMMINLFCFQSTQTSSSRSSSGSCRTCHRSPSKNVRLNFFLSHTWKKNLKHVSTRFRSRPTFLKKCLIHRSSFIFVRCRSTKHENSFEEFSWNENSFGAKALLNISNLIHGQSVLFTNTEVK